MLVSKKNKVFDEDLNAVIKKKPRCKKPRDKFSLMYTIPIQVLSFREEVTTSGGKVKRGKRFGFTVYDSLTCKQCKPHHFFHKRFGLNSHNKEHHGRNTVFKMPSIPNRSYTVPARSTRPVASVKNYSSLKRRVPAVRGITTSKSSPIEYELIDLEEDEEVDEIQVVDDISPVNNNEPSEEKKIANDESDDDSEILCVDVIEVNENRIRTFKLKDYRWMESSPLYQPKVFLMSSLNIKIREEETTDEVGEIEELNPLDVSNLSTFLNDNDVLVELDETIDGEVNIFGEAEPVQLEEAVFKTSPHIRNLFEEENKMSQIKRKALSVKNSPTKRSKQSDEDELLLIEEPDEDDVLDINSMLEVSLDETGENVTNGNDDIEIVEIEETTCDVLNTKDESIVIVDLDVDLNELPDVEIVSLDEDEDDHTENVELTTQESDTAPKLGSIKDLVSLWANEEKSLSTLKRNEEPFGKLRTKKRRSELKPYLISRGL